MGLLRPEGLSPCHWSLASPDIPESHIFKWTSRGTYGSTPVKYTINLWNEAGTTLLATKTVASNAQEMPMADLGYSFVIGQSYRWSVTIYEEAFDRPSKESAKAGFAYNACPITPFVPWHTTPEQGGLVRREYLEEIKNNVLYILEDYFAPPSLKASVEGLFKGNIVPSRLDFEKLESIVEYLYMKSGIFLPPKPIIIRREPLIKEGKLWDGLHEVVEEVIYQEPALERPVVSIEQHVEDSLGLSDIQRIRDYLTFLMDNNPPPVEKITVDFTAAPMYQIYDVVAKNDALADNTIDVSWKIEDAIIKPAVITFNKLSSVQQIRYYRVLYEYGPLNETYTSELYFRATDEVGKGNVKDGSVYEFHMDWKEIFYDLSTVALTKQKIQAFAIDHRGNTSTPTTVGQTTASNSKLLVGLWYSLVEYQIMPSANVDPRDARFQDGWKLVTSYTGIRTSLTQRVRNTGNGYLFYRVKAIDMNDKMKSEWAYIEHPTQLNVTSAPPAPQNVKWNFEKIGGLFFITLRWDESMGASNYELRMTNVEYGSNVTYTPDGPSFITLDQAEPNKTYYFYIRAVNGLGYSPWTTVMIKSPGARQVETTPAIGATSWGSKYGYSYTRDYLNFVSMGNSWRGLKKGLWIYDDAYWRNKLAGRTIIKVEIYTHRVNYYEAGPPTFWLHNHSFYDLQSYIRVANETPINEPAFFNSFTPGKEFKNEHREWIALPNSYGEALRDGKAKGIGLYMDKWSTTPRRDYHWEAPLRITYE